MSRFAAVVKLLGQCKLISLITTTRSCSAKDKASAAATRHNHAQTETKPNLSAMLEHPTYKPGAGASPGPVGPQLLGI